MVAGKVDGIKANSKFYWDAKWTYHKGQKVLFAASAGNPTAGTVDVYHAV